jgi:hypothetical protein
MSVRKLTRGKRAESSKNHQRRPMIYDFRNRWQVKLLVCNMPSDYKEGLEDAVDFFEVCVLAIH